MGTDRVGLVGCIEDLALTLSEVGPQEGSEQGRDRT